MANLDAEDLDYCASIPLPNAAGNAKMSLEAMLEKEEMTFSEALLDWLIKKNLNDPDV